jgi:hypothetical protein
LKSLLIIVAEHEATELKKEVHSQARCRRFEHADWNCPMEPNNAECSDASNSVKGHKSF